MAVVGATDDEDRPASSTTMPASLTACLGSSGISGRLRVSEPAARGGVDLAERRGASTRSFAEWAGPSLAVLLFPVAAGHARTGS